MREGVIGEQISTCVNGRIMGHATITEEGSMVVRAPVHQELYVLTRAQFEELYDPVGKDIDDKDGINMMLVAQGFKVYTPKATNMKWVLKLTAEDMQKIPSGLFFAKWGAIQHVEAGDYVAMPAPEDKATEIYKLPLELFVCYSDVKISRKDSKDKDAKKPAMSSRLGKWTK